LQHHQAGRLRQAEEAYRQILARQPNHADAIHNLGVISLQSGRNDAAVQLIRQAIAINPNYPEAHSNLGNVLADMDRLDEAIAAYRQAIALNPGLAEAHNNLGNALREKGQSGEAVAAFRRAIAINPDFPEAHRNLSLALLLDGDFQAGWEEYEWRWKCKDIAPARKFAQERWDGGPLEGRTILLHAAQGFGDSIQCIRYLPLVRERGARIIIECYSELERLFEPIAGECQLVVRGQPLPAFDLHCPMESLPRAFRTNLTNIPQSVPYLHADAEEAGKWHRRLADVGGDVKVGLAWGGNPIHKNDRNRSMKLVNLAPLGQAAGVKFFSLQKGAPAAEAKSPPPGLELVDWTEELGDLADTAALIANLDLVIAVDTVVVHLAGAMGKPVWTLLPFIPAWRWLLGRQDSPWYPTMRLFRQERRGDWDGVVRQAAEALADWTHGR
jgi:cytochrome c-type biogenesis protein CcmH/NrfG